jgi:CheY-like chemotaxis protein
MRVLLAEDESIIAMLFQDVLETAGHSVVVAGDGHAAVALASRNGPFDVLVTDLNMSGLSGADLIRWMRAHYPAMPIVVVTGSPPREGVAALATEGEPPLLFLKPIAPDGLLRAVETACRRHAAADLGHASPIGAVRCLPSVASPAAD